MNEQMDTPVSLKPNLSTVWHFVKEKGEQITKLVKHKVCAVSETRTGEIVSWKGLLDNDEYFFILAINGVIYAACEEREMLLPHNLHTVVYSDEVQKILDVSNQAEQFASMIQAKNTSLPKLMNNLKFQEMMDIFMWEYVSPSVEIYETIAL